MNIDSQINPALGDRKSNLIYQGGHEKWNYAVDTVIEWRNAS
jgi:hypothetical protein